jgi:uncharacterized protein
MRAALFGPVRDADSAMGSLAETAVFSQWLHTVALVDTLHHARWVGDPWLQLARARAS